MKSYSGTYSMLNFVFHDFLIDTRMNWGRENNTQEARKHKKFWKSFTALWVVMLVYEFLVLNKGLGNVFVGQNLIEIFNCYMTRFRNKKQDTSCHISSQELL